MFFYAQQKYSINELSIKPHPTAAEEVNTRLHKCCSDSGWPYS